MNGRKMIEHGLDTPSEREERRRVEQTVKTCVESGEWGVGRD